MDRKESKLIKEQRIEMIKGGGSGDGSGPTASPRTYPKGPVRPTADFLPNKGPRSKTDWLVGGV